MGVTVWELYYPSNISTLEAGACLQFPNKLFLDDCLTSSHCYILIYMKIEKLTKEISRQIKWITDIRKTINLGWGTGQGWNIWRHCRRECRFDYLCLFDFSTTIEVIANCQVWSWSCMNRSFRWRSCAYIWASRIPRSLLSTIKHQILRLYH